MLEIQGNIFDLIFPPNSNQIDKSIDAICITTNGITNYQGLAIMDAGTAGHIANIYPNIRKILGINLKKFGNVPSLNII